MSGLFVRFIVLLGIFAAVFLVSQVALGILWRHRERFSAINRRMRMIREGENREDVVARLRKNAPSDMPGVPPLVAGMIRSVQRTLFMADISVLPARLAILIGGLFAAILAILLAATGYSGMGWTTGVVVLLVAIAFCIAIVIPVSIISIRAQNRRKRMEEQFPVALDVFVRALRSGHPVASAIDLLTQEMDDPIGSEFGLVADEVSYGADMIDALQEMADRWDNGDMRIFVVSLAVQSETGGNLAEILDNLSSVIRARAAMYLKIRALSSEGRLTGVMLTVLPILTFLGMFLVNPGFYLDVARDPIFIFGFAGIVLLYLVGLFAIRRMIDLKV